MQNLEIRSLVVRKHYNFIVAPIESDTTCNADTARPSEEDAHINTTPCHYNYVHGVRNNAWGESVCIQALCDVFNITINLLHVRIDRPGGQPIENTLDLTPSNSASTQEIDIALVMQFHFFAS